MTQKVETLSLHGLEVVENVVNRLISTIQIGFKLKKSLKSEIFIT